MVNDYRIVQRQTAQYDLFNRLHSIHRDEAFIRSIAEHYEGRYEVVGMSSFHVFRECGTWYCDPSTSSSTYAYFKSTDGHAGTWSFNLRRSNLSLASRLEERDSTRRGKRMPDALSKTVPIWCTVINRAVNRQRQTHATATPEGAEGSLEAQEWDTALHLPPFIPPSERDQIETLLPAWVDALCSSSLVLPNLTKPLRPFWIHPATQTPPSIPLDAPYTPVLCLSASMWVGSEDDVPSVTRVGAGRTVGFSYVQGAGDDDELWSRGLTPSVFYRNRAKILEADRDDLPALVDELVSAARADQLADGIDSLHFSEISPSSDSDVDARIPGLIGLPSPTSRLAVQLGQPITPTPAWQPQGPIRATDLQASGDAGVPGPSRVHTIRVVLADKQRYPPWTHTYSTDVSIFACPSARAEPKAYERALDELVDHLDEAMERHPGTGLALVPGAESDLEIVAPAASGPDTNVSVGEASNIQKDGLVGPPSTRPPLPPVNPGPERLLDYRRTVLPIALVLLLSNPDLRDPDDQDRGMDTTNITKKDISDMLHRLVALWPDGNPPRAALKRVNEYLMSPYA